MSETGREEERVKMKLKAYKKIRNTAEADFRQCGVCG